MASFQKEKSSGTNNSFPIDYIIQNSKARKSHYDLSKIRCPELKRIKSAFFKKWFDQTPVTISETDQIIFRFSTSDKYYFFDYVDSDSVFFCSILEYMDDCHTFRMYHFTIDKRRQLVVHADWIATQSHKSGYSVDDRLSYDPKGNKLTVNSKIICAFHNFGRRMKSVRETFRFSLNGTTRKTFKR
ncbi:hypothetical protein D3C71_345440 [compost metagenome]